MIILKNQSEIKSNLADNKNLALIPTMGNLHAGHISLIEKAKNYASTIIVSIFVNPIQFNSQIDLKNYPRTLTKDIDTLNKLGVDILFNPSEKDITNLPLSFGSKDTLGFPVALLLVSYCCIVP